MNYRELGKTGLSVSEIAMGCEGFVHKSDAEISELVTIMREEGINFIDLYTPDPQVLTGLGKAIHSCRDAFILQSHLGSVWREGQYERTRDPEKVRTGFEERLAQMGTDHFEVGMIHYVDSLSDWAVTAENVLPVAEELKKAGKIRCIGLSSHNPVVAAEAVKTGKIDVLMFSINPCYDLQPAGEDVEALWADEAYEKDLLNMDPDRQALYELCERMGVGIDVMKAFGGGDLLDSELSPAKAALTPYACIGYALSRPGVSAIMCGARTPEQLRYDAGYVRCREEERDYASQLASLPKISWQGHCMYCGHCAPCPVGISVADVTKFLNLCKAQNEVPETVREHYAVLEHHASECIQCGACASRCPFMVDAPANMLEAAKVLGY